MVHDNLNDADLGTAGGYDPFDGHNAPAQHAQAGGQRNTVGFRQIHQLLQQLPHVQAAEVQIPVAGNEII